MKFKIGDKVRTIYGNGEILYIHDSQYDSCPYLIGIKGYSGHNGRDCCDIEYIKAKGYKNQCKWCAKYEFKRLSLSDLPDENANIVDIFKKIEELFESFFLLYFIFL